MEALNSYGVPGKVDANPASNLGDKMEDQDIPDEWNILIVNDSAWID